MHMGVLPVSLCALCLPDICASQKRASTPPLEINYTQV